MDFISTIFFENFAQNLQFFLHNSQPTRFLKLLTFSQILQNHIFAPTLTTYAPPPHLLDTPFKFFGGRKGL